MDLDLGHMGQERVDLDIWATRDRNELIDLNKGHTGQERVDLNTRQE